MKIARFVLKIVALSLAAAAAVCAVIAYWDKLSELGSNDGSVSLKPANDEEISAENPVELQLDLEKRSDILAGALVLTPPRDSANIIQAGTVTVEYTDENGETQTIEASICIPLRR